MTGGAFQLWQQLRERQAMVQMAMQIVMSTAYRLLSAADENAWLILATALKISICNCEFALSNNFEHIIVWLRWVSCLVGFLPHLNLILRTFQTDNNQTIKYDSHQCLQGQLIRKQEAPVLCVWMELTVELEMVCN